MKKIPLILALLLAALTGSACGAHVGRTVVRPLPLTVDRPDMVLLTIGDSQTGGRGQWPPPALPNPGKMCSDTCFFSSGTIPFVWPDANGRRLGMADTARFDAYRNPYNSVRVPTARQFSKARLYAQDHTWTARLAQLLGTSKWYSISYDGTGITDYWGVGSDMNGDELAGENWGWNNVAAARADIIIIKLGINDANTGQGDTAQRIITAYQTLLDKLWQVNPDVKILLMGIHPYGGSTHASAGTIGRADSLEAWITGFAPYYNDSTGAKQSALGRYAAKARAGQFSTYSYAWRYVNYNLASADTARSACSDSALTKWHDGAFLHFNWRGDQLHAQDIARDVFGAVVPDGADTTDIGNWPTPLHTRPRRTIYVDAANGDNYLNWVDPFTPQRALGSFVGALWRAMPGDSVVFAPGNYGKEVWTYTRGYQWRPYVWQWDEDDRIVLDGRGLATYNISQADTNGFGFTPITTSAPDSIFRAFYDLKGWKFKSDGVQQLMDMDHITGVRFRECEFDSLNAIMLLQPESGITFPAGHRINLTFDGCTFKTWGWATGAGIYALGVHNVTIDFHNNTVADTGVPSPPRTRGLIRMSGTAAANTSTMRLNATGNTIYARDLGTASFFNSMTDCDMFIANNSFRFGPGCTSATQNMFTNGTTTGGGDTLWFVNNLITFEGSTSRTDLGTWPADAEIYSRNLYESILSRCTVTTANEPTKFTVDSLRAGAVSDTICYGGRDLIQPTGWPAVRVSDYGVDVGTNHASIGPTQYAADPMLWGSPIAGHPEYARFSTMQEIVNLINAGVLPQSSGSVLSTHYPVPAPDKAMGPDAARHAIYRAEWSRLSESNRGKFRMRIQ